MFIKIVKGKIFIKIVIGKQKRGFFSLRNPPGSPDPSNKGEKIDITLGTFGVTAVNLDNTVSSQVFLMGVKLRTFYTGRKGCKHETIEKGPK